MKNINLYSPEDFFPTLNEQAEVDNVLNNDVYKFFMLDFILAHPEYRWIPVKWKMTVRSEDVRTVNVIPREKLEAQLQKTKDLVQGVSEADRSFLRGITDSKWNRLFKEETLDFLANFQLPEFRIAEDDTGNYELEFEGPWENSMMWEIFGLKIVNTLYLSEYLKKEEITDVEFTKMMTEVLAKLFEDIETFKQNPEVNFSEFWTRRSASTTYQRMVNTILSEQLPGQYLGTSNVLLAKELWSANPKWTNAHELRMIPTALYDDPKDIVAEMYEIDRKWAAHYPELAILLPDTYGTSYYLDNCPEDIILSHVGMRFDSKAPMDAIPEYIDWLLENGQDPQTKIWIPSDGLNAVNAGEIAQAFHDKLWKLSFGIGTNLTNNTKWTYPRKQEPLGPFGSFSVVIKPSEVQRSDGTWVSTVKLSDNPNKAVWSPKRVALFKEIFWAKGMETQSVSV